MKNAETRGVWPKLALLVSLAINVALGVYVLRGPDKRETSNDRGKFAEVESRHRNLAGESLTPGLANYQRAQVSWESVESGDYQEYIANLRTIRCPEETIKDIIRADVKKLYA